MDTEEYMVLVDGVDRSDSIHSFHLEEGAYPKYRIVYRNSPQAYVYNRSRVDILSLQDIVSPGGKVVTVNGKPVPDAKRGLDFGEYCRVIRGRGAALFACFKEIAGTVGLAAQNGNILSRQYEMISHIHPDSVLANYSPTAPSPGSGSLRRFCSIPLA